MKDKEKQIEEMAKRIHIATDLYYIECIKIATYLFEKDNCRIIDKDQVVVLKTEYERLIYVEGELQEMNADYYNELKELKDSLKNSVVLSREEYEKLTAPRYIIETKKLTNKEVLEQLKTSTFCIVDNNTKIEIIPTRAEIEKENERLLEQSNKTYNIWVKDTEQLKDRIAELEKEIAKYKQKLTTNQWVQEIRKEALKQFAERLKEKYRIWETDKQVIDETLKEFEYGQSKPKEN